jgi:hypothetical protein
VLGFLQSRRGCGALWAHEKPRPSRDSIARLDDGGIAHRNREACTFTNGIKD